jgi:hypothetical protein
MTRVAHGVIPGFSFYELRTEKLGGGLSRPVSRSGVVR